MEGGGAHGFRVGCLATQPVSGVGFRCAPPDLQLKSTTRLISQISTFTN
jgi:hypothetical protein